MRIGIDGRELSGQPTGVGRYLQRLLREWALAAHGHRFSVYSPDGRAALPPGVDGEIVVVPGTGGTRWEQGALAARLRRDRPDVFFAPGYTAPLRSGIPTVVAIHDVSFLDHPEWFTWREGTRRRWLTRLAASRARRVLTISEFSRGRIARRLRLSPERIVVIPLGAGLDRRPAAFVPREPLVLFVGTILNRRHLPLLVEAFARLVGRGEDIRLAIVGRNRTHPHEDIAAVAVRTGVAERVQLHDWISDAELSDLYARASAFAFLSEYEGLGLTPLEALAAGIPPVVLDTPVAREACGDASIRVRADVEEIAAALKDALDAGSPRRAAVLAAAPAVLARSDWRRAADATLVVLEEAARP